MLGFRPISALPIAGQPVAGNAGVTLLPALFSDADTFFAHTLNRGAVTLTAPLFTDGDTFFSHTLASPITLLPALYTDADTFNAHTLSATITLLPSLFNDGDTFYTHVLSQAGGAVTLLPSLFNDGDTFFSHTLAASITLTAGLYNDADTFFAHTLNRGVVTLLPSLFTDADTFFAHTLNRGVVTLLPALFTDADTFFAHTLNRGAVTLTASPYGDGDTFFSHTLTQIGGPQALTASLFTDADTFFTAFAGPPIAPVAPSFSHWQKTKDRNKPKAPTLPPPVEAGEVVIDEAFLRQMEEERLAALVLKAKQEALQRIEELRANAVPNQKATKALTLARKAVEDMPEAPARYVNLSRPETPQPPSAAPRTITLQRFDVVETTPEVRTQVVTLFRPPPKPALVEPIKGSITVRALGPRRLPEPEIRKAKTISLRRSPNRMAQTG